jgi:Tfp pilus assembly protein PilN
MALILEWFLTTKLGRVAGIAVLCILAFFGFRAWLAIHDASTRHTALQGYVLASQLAVKEAENAEIKRQLAAGQKALKQYAELLAAEQAKSRAADEALEQEIAAHEKETTSQGRSCPISPADRDWLLKP